MVLAASNGEVWNVLSGGGLAMVSYVEVRCSFW